MRLPTFSGFWRMPIRRRRTLATPRRAASCSRIPLCLALGLALLAGPTAQAQRLVPPPDPSAAQAPPDKKDFSQAERLLFMDKPMLKLKPPVTLRYSFRKSGSLEEGFEDKVLLRLKQSAEGTCCAIDADFLTGPRQIKLPEIDKAEANPVLLYFLERDVREMNRLTKGSQAYYRKRIRLAAYDGAVVTELPFVYRGASVSGRQVELSPYANDPARSRFEKFSRKTYQFMMSDAVPGGVYGIRTVVRGEAADAPPLIVEELYLDGAEPLKSSPPVSSAIPKTAS